jgi:hypothetical protein
VVLARYQNNSPSSNSSIISEIPEEEMMTFANQKCINNPSYNNFEEIDLLLKFIHWQKVSHGLFDYEMKQIIK